MDNADSTRDSRADDILKLAYDQFSRCGWHWFKYHLYNRHPFAVAMMQAIIACDLRIEGFAKDFLPAVAEISGKEKDPDHYDQLMQRMAELLVIRQCLQFDLPGARYTIEPTAGASKKRPDLVVDSDALRLVIEIKAPAANKLKELRQRESVQVLSRLPPTFGNVGEKFAAPVVLPRDNAVKDFLISANDKFASFKEEKACVSLLVIVWDDHIHEVITALAHPASGLLTPNSFAKDRDGVALTHPHVDGVVIVRHLAYFIHAAADKDIEERMHAFDFGGPHSLPNVFIPNPASATQVPAAMLDVLRALPLGDERIMHAADYRPKELILWI